MANEWQTCHGLLKEHAPESDEMREANERLKTQTSCQQVFEYANAVSLHI